MSFVPLPDGSRITTFSGAAPGAVERDTADKFSVLSDLRRLKGNFLALSLLRQMVAREGDSLGSGPVGDEALLEEVARLLVSGRFLWVEPRSEDGGEAPGKAHSVAPPAPAQSPPPPALQPTPPTKKPLPPPPAPVPPPTEKVVVTPELKVEYKVVLLDRELNKHLQGTETKAKVSGTAIQVSFKQGKPSPKFPRGLKLKTSGAGAIEAYLDADLSTKIDLTKPIPNEKLGSPLKLWLKGKTKGKFDLTLEIETGDDRFKTDPPVTEKMGVVEILMVPHEPDQSALDALEVDPDTEPVGKYYDDLRDKVLPDQKELTDERKIKVGRLLHVQKDGHFGRAKLIVKKLEASQWPEGTDEYKIVVAASKSADGADSTALKIFEAEWEGSAKTLPAELLVSDLKSGEKTLWVEGAEASKKPLDVRLGLGVDRATGGLGKEIKKNGDWAQFTVAQIKSIKLDYTAASGKPNAWDDANSKFSINFKTDPDGRKVKIKVTLSEKLKDINVRFMLAPGKDNLKAPNWGVDLPGTWKWKDITAAVKHKDKADRKKVLHQAALTDSDGVASSELVLSRFGGDRFRPRAYLDCDPHLAKYVEGHPDLEKKEPAKADKDITVWRKFWYQVVKVEGMNPPAMGGAEGQYTRVKADMVLTTELAVSRATVDTFAPKAIYPKYMVILNGGNSDALVVSDSNKGQFFSGYAAEAEKPIKIPILICDAQWDEGGNSSPITGDVAASGFPVTVTTDKLMLNPPLQGGTLFVSGAWVAAEWDPTLKAGAGDWTNVRNGNFANANVSISPTRTDLHAVRLALPAGVGATTAQTRVWIQNLILQGANGPYLGEYSSSTKRILAVYDPTQPGDFQNTIAHEIGHSFRQVAKPASIASGIPAHPEQYDKQGSHCKNLTNKCVMYESGPITGSLDRFCDMCHPYLLVNNMKSQA